MAEMALTLCWFVSMTQQSSLCLVDTDVWIAMQVHFGHYRKLPTLSHRRGSK